MNRPLASMLPCAAVLAAVALAPVASPAENVVYAFTALPGEAATCQWFDDNLNDRSIEALSRQTDLLYNRVALPPGAPVSVSQTATTTSGHQVVSFALNGKTVCTSAEAVYPPTPSPAPSPASSATPSPNPAPSSRS